VSTSSRLTGIDSDLPVSRPVKDPVSERGELMLRAKPAPTRQPTCRSADHRPEDGTPLRQMMPNG
jgi:hypothetical protein